jgi:hypothetical protein
MCDNLAFPAVVSPEKQSEAVEVLERNFSIKEKQHGKYCSPFPHYE